MRGEVLQAPRVRAETFNKPDFEELKALINGIFMKEGELNISQWCRLQAAGCRMVCS